MEVTRSGQHKGGTYRADGPGKREGDRPSEGARRCQKRENTRLEAEPDPVSRRVTAPGQWKKTGASKGDPVSAIPVESVIAPFAISTNHFGLVISPKTALSSLQQPSPLRTAASSSHYSTKDSGGSTNNHHSWLSRPKRPSVTSLQLAYPIVFLMPTTSFFFSSLYPISKPPTLSSTWP